MGVPLPANEKEDLETTPSGKASTLSKQNIFTRENINNIPTMGKSLHLGMPTILITTKGVEVLLNRLKHKKAVGPDLISTSILKEFAEPIAQILSVLL